MLYDSRVTSAPERKDLLARLASVEKIVRADLLAQYRSDPALMARAMQRSSSSITGGA
jgi:hypothetical protein